MADFFQKIKKYTYNKYSPWILLGILIILMLSISLIQVLKIKQLPSPLYGGDLYYHNGGIINILEGNSYLKSPQLLGVYEWTPPFFKWIVSGVAIITNTNSVRATFLSSLLFQLASMISFFYISNKIMKTRYLGLIPAMLITLYFPAPKYTSVGVVLIMPWFFYSLYNFFTNKNIRSSIFLGIMLGVVAITHSNFFIGAVLIFGLFFIFDIIRSLIKNRNSTESISLIKFYAIAGIIGFIISLIMWYVPIVIFHLSLPNDIPSYNYYDLSQPGALFYVSWILVKEMFFTMNFADFNASLISIASIIAIAGFILLIFDRKKTENKIFFVLLITSVLIAANHHYLSYPLMGANFFPDRIMQGSLSFLYFIFSVYIIHLFFITAAKKYKITQIFFLILSITILFFIAQKNYTIFDKDHYLVMGRSELDPLHSDLIKWTNENTNINDVFLSTNEISFMLNSLTGRKVLNSRRAHMGSYVDVDSRYIASAAILYGNNDDLRMLTLKEYHVKYLYWENYWIQSEFTFDNQGKLVSWFDPLMIKYSKDAENTLFSLNISYAPMETWLDPAINGPRYKKFPILLVSPQNYRAFDKPWNAMLDNHLELKKEFTYNGQVMARIYEIKY